jgi:hypothetical protein
MSKTGLALTTAAVLTMLPACTSTPSTERGQVISQTNYQRPSVQYTSPGNQTGHELRRTTEQDTHFALEGIVVHGQAMYEQENIRRQLGEFQSYFVLREDRSLILDDLDHVVGETSESIYIPTIVNNSSGQPASRITLRSDGPYGIRANMTQFQTDGVETGIFHETHNDIGHNIKTITFGTNAQGEPMEWYAPRVETGGDSPEALGFYMMQVSGTAKEISPEGTITLDSTSGILRPTRVSRETYNQRTPMPEPIPPITPEDNTGQGTEVPK